MIRIHYGNYEPRKRSKSNSETAGIAIALAIGLATTIAHVRHPGKSDFDNRDFIRIRCVCMFNVQFVFYVSQYGIGYFINSKHPHYGKRRFIRRCIWQGVFKSLYAPSNAATGGANSILPYQQFFACAQYINYDEEKRSPRAHSKSAPTWTTTNPMTELLSQSKKISPWKHIAMSLIYIGSLIGFKNDPQKQNLLQGVLVTHLAGLSYQLWERNKFKLRPSKRPKPKIYIQPSKDLKFDGIPLPPNNFLDWDEYPYDCAESDNGEGDLDYADYEAKHYDKKPIPIDWKRVNMSPEEAGYLNHPFTNER